MENAFICVQLEGLQSLLQIALSGKEDLEVFVERESKNFNISFSFVEDVRLLIVDSVTLSSIDEDLIKDIPIKILIHSEDNPPCPKDGWSYFHQDDWAKAASFYLEDQGKHHKQATFSNIPFYILKNIEESICDIYMEITKEGLPHKIKLFNAGEDIDQQVIEKYLDKGVQTAAVNSEDKNQFLISISNKMYLKISSSSDKTVMAQALDTSLYLLRDIGFNSISTQVLEGVIENINMSLRKNSSSDLKLIKDLLSMQGARYYKKAHMTALLSSRILQAKDWSTHAQQETMSMLALLCDMTLENPEMLFILSLSDLEASSLKKHEKDIVLYHAKNAFKLVQAYKDRPAELDNLILNHHAQQNGIGFSDNLSASLNKLTVIHRICEDFSIELIKLQEMNAEIKLMDIFSTLYQRHNKKILHLAIDDLKKCFIN